jgi:DMSO/TMAO reductase YedYZ molybdopterin-dependent catalytic subunit
MKRRLFLVSSIGAALASCAPIGTALNNNARANKFLQVVESLDFAAFGHSRALAHEYPESAISPQFPVDSLPTPSGAQYAGFAATHFRSYRLVVDGAVARPLSLTIQNLTALRQATQITRHDCVEGWSVIAKWTGVPLGTVVDLSRPHPDARFVVFHCMDRDDSGVPYYESLDLVQARHPQTILALRLNDEPLQPEHGAPVRLRVATQLGYKSAKWVSRIQIVGSLAHIGGGSGGYWEDQGYEWYAGI